MDFPRTTKPDIEDRESIDIIGRVIQGKSFDNGDQKYRLLDPEQNEIELKIWASESDNYDIETDHWYLLERAEGDEYKGDRKLSSNRGKMGVTLLEEPPEFVKVPENNDSPQQVDGGVLAIDIETISTVSEHQLDLDNSDHIELLCIGVGFASEAGSPGRSQVLFREGTSVDDERELLERFCEFVDSRSPDQLLLFKGDFDIQHLQGRAKRVGSDSGLEDRVRDIFETHEINNLNPLGKLEENYDTPDTYWDIYNHSLNPANWRKDHPNYDGDLDDPTVSNKDIPYFGERFLELCDQNEITREYRTLRELIRHYTIADIDPLFDVSE